MSRAGGTVANAAASTATAADVDDGSASELVAAEALVGHLVVYASVVDAVAAAAWDGGSGGGVAGTAAVAVAL